MTKDEDLLYQVHFVHRRVDARVTAGGARATHEATHATRADLPGPAGVAAHATVLERKGQI